MGRIFISPAKFDRFLFRVTPKDNALARTVEKLSPITAHDGAGDSRIGTHAIGIKLPGFVESLLVCLQK
jgi:hypothetical protein